MRLTKQQLRDSLDAAIDFHGLGVKPMAVDALVAQVFRSLVVAGDTGEGNRLTRDQLRERAQQVAASFGRGTRVAVDDDELAALAKAWGVEVEPPLLSWRVTYAYPATHVAVVKAADAQAAARTIREQFGKVVIDEVEVVNA